MLGWGENFGVTLLTNDLGNGYEKNPVSGIGIAYKSFDRFEIEGVFHKGTVEYVGSINFYVNDIIKGNNNSFLIFSRNFGYDPLGENTLILPGKLRDIRAMKKETGLNLEEEKFLRDYARMNPEKKIEYSDKYNCIQEQIQKHLIEVQESVKHLLNDAKGHGGELELF